jgi:hypothetical protein
LRLERGPYEAQTERWYHFGWRGSCEALSKRPITTYNENGSVRPSEFEKSAAWGGVVHDTESFVETESLVYKRLLDIQKAKNLFHSVTIFRESGNIEFCVVGDNVLRHRVVGTPVVKGERCNAGSKFGVLLSRQCPRRDFHKIEFRIKMKTAVIYVSEGKTRCTASILGNEKVRPEPQGHRKRSLDALVGNVRGFFDIDADEATSLTRLT